MVLSEKFRKGDRISIVIDPKRSSGSLDLVSERVGEDDELFSAAEGARRLRGRKSRPDLSPDENLPDDTRLCGRAASCQRRYLGRLRLRRPANRRAVKGRSSRRNRTRRHPDRSHPDS